MRWFRRSTIPCSLYSHLSSVEHISVHLVHSILGISLVEVSDESESPGFLCKTISRNVNIANFTITFKYWLQFLRGNTIREIVNLQANHSLNIGRAPAAERFASSAVTISLAVAVTISASTSVVAIPAPTSASPTHSVKIFFPPDTCQDLFRRVVPKLAVVSVNIEYRSTHARASCDIGAALAGWRG